MVSPTLRQTSSLLAKTNSPAANAATTEVAETPPPAASTPSSANSRSNQDCMFSFTWPAILNIVGPKKNGLIVLKSCKHAPGNRNKLHTFQHPEGEQRLEPFRSLHQRHTKLT